MKRPLILKYINEITQVNVNISQLNCILNSKNQRFPKNVKKISFKKCPTFKKSFKSFQFDKINLPLSPSMIFFILEKGFSKTIVTFNIYVDLLRD